jgi:catechol 2,3-dioxygenase-like lactoylglutathione lyase family enzyme
MHVDHLLAVVPVTDLDRARGWYERLLGCEPDNTPMETLVEWQVVPGGWVQVYVDPETAGRTAVNLSVPDLDDARARLVQLDLSPGPVQEAARGVRLCPLVDPDGNRITLIGGFRVDY